MMTKPDFQTLFYPAEGVSVTKKGDASLSLPATILVPHAATEWVGKDLDEAYGAVSSLHPTLVVVISSLHGENLEEDKEQVLFAPEGDGMTITGKEVHFAPVPEGVTMRDCYFHEEPAIEVQLAYIVSLYPGVPVLPLLAKSKPNSKECKKIRNVLDLLANEKRTLLVVSSNASASLPSPEAWKEAKAFTEALQQGERILDLSHKGIVSACGSGIIDALHCRWSILSASLAEHHYDVMPDHAPQAQGPVVWHVSAIALGD